jgi:adenine-specific DNA-methyltransferase
MSLLLKPTIIPSDSWNYILESVDQLSQSYASKTTALEKRSLGQVFTSLPMARQLISLISDFNNKNNSYADLGTGTGILSASLIARHSSECPQPPTSLLAFEKDTKLHSQWVKSFSDIAKKIGMNDDDCKLECDFYQQAESILTTGKPQSGESVSRLVSNPPYIKLGSKTHLSLLLKEHGIHAPNHYAAFVALSVVWLENEGDLLAILPRSFFSGIYFKKFRDWLSSKMSIEHIVAYSSRSNFKNVLQESVCIYLKKTKQRDVIRVSYCEHAEAEPTHDLLIPKSQILGDIWYLPSTPMQLDALKKQQKIKAYIRQPWFKRKNWCD